MYLFFVLCLRMHKLVTDREWLFNFVFAGIENPRYDWIRPEDAFLAVYLCGCMPFVPIVASIGAFLFYDYSAWRAIIAFAIGIVAAPLVIKILWNIGINLMLAVTNKS